MTVLYYRKGQKEMWAIAIVVFKHVSLRRRFAPVVRCAGFDRAALEYFFLIKVTRMLSVRIIDL